MRVAIIGNSMAEQTGRDKTIKKVRREHDYSLEQTL